MFRMMRLSVFFLFFFFFFFNDTATTEIYTLSLHDALPIWFGDVPAEVWPVIERFPPEEELGRIVAELDRKSTRLNSSHANISYAVFCLKKKKNRNKLHDARIDQVRRRVYLRVRRS